jgi:hypothetical protein
LAHPIHEQHQREWYIQGLLPMNWIPLTQQRIAKLPNALEQLMKIESMAGYTGSLRMTRPPVDVNLVQLQGHISALIEKIQELMIPRPRRPQVRCTRCYMESHLVNKCLQIRGMGPPQNLMVPPQEPVRGVAQMSTNLPFHNPTLYHSFLGGQVAPVIKYYEIYRIHGHGPRQCTIMQKYSTVPNTVHCELCASTTHTTNQCRVLDALVDKLDRTTFRVNENFQGPRRGRGGGDRGDFRGGRTGGRGPRRCYNCDEKVHMSRDCPRPRWPWCSHYRTNGHAT